MPARWLAALLLAPGMTCGFTESQVVAWMDEFDVPGVSIALVEDGAFTRQMVLGVANAETGEALTAEHRFQVASISKPVAAFAVHRLAVDAEIDLEEPIQRYVQRWTLPGDPAQLPGVTVGRVLSHTAGLTLGGYPGFPEAADLPGLEESLSGATNGAGDVRLEDSPGEGFRYSGGGYTLLQLMLEEVTREAFEDVARALVFAPLGMSRSTFEPDQVAPLARGHDRFGNPIDNYRFTARAAAGLHTTALDLVRFELALMSGAYPAISRAMSEPVLTRSGERITGMGLLNINGLVGHSGSNFGWKADMWWHGADGIVVLTNSESGREVGELVMCAFTSFRGIAQMDEHCEAVRSQHGLFRAVYLVSLGVAMFAVFGLILTLVRRRLSLNPGGAARSVSGWLLVVLGLVAASVLFTSFLPSAVAGMNVPLSTLNLLPHHLAKAAPWLVLALICGGLSLLSRHRATLSAQPEEE